MDQWISERLSECLGFPVPGDMVEYILSMKSSDEAEDYFQTLLDFSIPEHRTFFNDYKMRLFTSRTFRFPLTDQTLKHLNNPFQGNPVQSPPPPPPVAPRRRSSSRPPKPARRTSIPGESPSRTTRRTAPPPARPREINSSASTGRTAIWSPTRSSSRGAIAATASR